ncbi:MAG TPA: membrane dipeptidase [Phycisphaerae bacterium]|nr:membrane dipeptidase [Phycisphaerae bacterium]
MTYHWFDGHLDLAYLAQQGRDLTATLERCGGGLTPAAVTFPELRKGNVRAAFATIFVQRRVDEAEAKQKGVEPLTGPWTYTTPDEAFAASAAQLGIYQHWNRSNLVELVSANNRWGGSDRLKIVLLMEGAAGLRHVTDLQRFYDDGVRIVALTWLEGNQWSGGDNSGGDVTPQGRELIAEIDRLNCIHDVSHLSEAAFWTLMSTAKGIKIASHSNARALLPGKQFPERNLSDNQLRALAQSPHAVVGINLLSAFLASGPNAPKRATIQHVLNHIKHIEDVTGRRDLLALGSDFDGGYPRTSWCENLDGPTQLHLLADALADAGWSNADIHRFAWQNWADLLAAIGITVASPLE